MGRCDDCMKNPVHPDKKCCFNCARVGPECEVWHNCGEDCTGWKSKVVTNAQKIRAMSDEELADFIYRCEMNDIDYANTFCDLCNGKYECDQCRLDWLKQPAE